MQRTWRLPLLLLLAVFALFTAGCGVEAGDTAAPSTKNTSSSDAETTEPDKGDTSDTTDTTADEGDTTTTEPTERSPEDQAAYDAVLDTYTELGFTEDEAACLADGVLALQENGGDPSDTADVMDIMNGCDIPISRLGDISEDSGLESPEDAMRFGLETGFKNAGMTDEQASCMADAYIEEFGTDASSAGDPSAMMDLFEVCDVDITDLGN